MLRPSSSSVVLTTRPASLDDQQTVLRLMDDADRWFTTVSVDEAMRLLAGAPALLLLANGRPCGMLIADWVGDAVTWVRLLVLSGGVSTRRRSIRCCRHSTTYCAPEARRESMSPVMNPPTHG